MVYKIFILLLSGLLYFENVTALNNDNAVFNNPREYKGMDSNYFPVKVNNHLYMSQNEEIDGVVANE